MKLIPPPEIRALRAQMELKALSIKEVSQLSRLPYQTCSAILRGRQVHPKYLLKIQAAIEKAPVHP